MPVPTLPDVKQQLNITGSTHDELLNAYLKSALALVEARVGPSTVRAFTEVVNVRANGVNLSYRPIVSVDSLVPLISTWPTFAATDVSFDARAGTVWRKDLGTLAGAYTVSYTAGWATFPENYFLATLVTVQHLWRTQRGGSGRPNQGGTDEVTVSLNGTISRALAGGSLSLPTAALELIGDGIYFGGIA